MVAMQMKYQFDKYERRDPLMFCRSGEKHLVEIMDVFGVKWKSCMKCGDWLGWVKDDK